MKHEITTQVDIIKVISDAGIQLTKRGANHIGCCPFHDDSKASLVVSETRQKFKCFPCGESGDAIDFVMKRFNVDFGQAVRNLQGNDTLIATDDQKKIIERHRNKNTWEQLPIWDGEIPPTYIHPINGKPNVIHEYRNLKNELIGYTCKFVFEDGSKDVLPYTYGVYENGVKSWRYGGFKSPRPMYGLNFLGAFPSATVVLVEGEKCADFGNSRIINSEYKGKYIFISWIGGSNAVPQTDFSMLSNRNVILWADNDEPGAKAMKHIHVITGGRFVHIPSDLPHKWDVADSGFSAVEIIDFIDSNLSVKPFRYNIEPEPQPIEEPELPVKTSNEYFRILGYGKNDKGNISYWFYSFEHKMVINFTPSNITKSNLMQLAPIQWWQKKYPSGGNSKLDTDSIAQMLINECVNKGVFSVDKIRGRGAWRDGKNIVLHVGTHLIVNGKKTELHDFESEFLYEINAPIKYGGRKPLSNQEAAKFLDLIKWFSWDHETTAYKFAGWLIIAPFCGVLNWRPQGWLTATSGAGKSWLQDNLVSNVLGDIALSMNSDTTAAGIRQTLMSDSRPIIFDETEANTLRARENLQNVIELMRSSSSPKGAEIIKGSQSGIAQRYNIKTMSMFSSIGVALTNRADIRRFSIFSLRKDSTKRGEEFDRFKERFFSVVTKEYIEALQQRTIDLLPVIIKNTDTFSKAATRLLGSNELGSQLGGMIAGAYSLTSDKEISLDRAIKFMQEHDWEQESRMEEQKDEILLFDTIMGLPVKIDSMGYVTIGDIVMRLVTGEGSSRLQEEYIYKELPHILGRLGIRIVSNEYICIASKNDSLKKMLKDTPWVDSMSSILARLHGASADLPRNYMPGEVKKRGVKIPLSLLTDSVI